MNLLNYIETYELDNLRKEFINLHTKNFDNAYAQCVDFFASHYGNDRFFTISTSYNKYAGCEYQLKKSQNGTYWLKYVACYEL